MLYLWWNWKANCKSNVIRIQYVCYKCFLKHGGMWFNISHDFQITELNVNNQFQMIRRIFLFIIYRLRSASVSINRINTSALLCFLSYLVKHSVFLCEYKVSTCLATVWRRPFPVSQSSLVKRQLFQSGSEEHDCPSQSLDLNPISTYMGWKHCNRP